MWFLRKPISGLFCPARLCLQRLSVSQSRLPRPSHDSSSQATSEYLPPFPTPLTPLLSLFLDQCNSCFTSRRNSNDTKPVKSMPPLTTPFCTRRSLSTNTYFERTIASSFSFLSQWPLFTLRIRTSYTSLRTQYYSFSTVWTSRLSNSFQIQSQPWNVFERSLRSYLLFKIGPIHNFSFDFSDSTRDSSSV